MKPIALLLIGFIVLLSGFSGIAWTNIKPAEPADCCMKMANACQHQPAKKKQAADDCGQPGCHMMFACSTCGFVVEKPLSIKPVYANPLPKPVAHYIPGDTAGFNLDNWKPPRTC